MAIAQLTVLLIMSLIRYVNPLCPQKCNCHFNNVDYLTTDCRWKHLKNVPQILDNKTNSLLLNHNTISYVSGNSLQYLPWLLEVDLSYNNISHIPVNMFSKNNILSSLSLKSNPLLLSRGIPILNATFLTRLDLSQCNLTFIYREAFLLTPFLWELNLSGNKLNTLHTMVFNPLISLLSLDITANPLLCDCSLQNLYNWTLQRSLYMTENIVQCSSSELMKELPADWSVVQYLTCDGFVEYDEDISVYNSDYPLFGLHISELALLFCTLGILLVMTVICIGISGNCLKSYTAVETESVRSRRNSTKSVVSISSRRRKFSGTSF